MIFAQLGKHLAEFDGHDECFLRVPMP